MTLITDYDTIDTKSKFPLVKIYSIGLNESFNSLCTMVFPTLEEGVKIVLKNKEEKIIMTEFEKLSDTCKIRWIEDCDITTQKYTQVSAYIFNEKNQLLIVKNNVWTVPGGHPEKGETQLETLNREIMEEACVTLKDMHYLGAVEVVENDETYYQLRYTAKVDKLLPFQLEWETCEREFVDLDDLVKYIKWSKGVTFNAQIESAKNHWRF